MAPAHTPAMDTALAAWDIGGAHLKAALLAANGALLHVAQWPTPAWRGSVYLERALDTAMQEIGTQPGTHVVTMTAELADCFTDRATGVLQIVDLLEARLHPATIRYYSANGLCTAAGAAAAPLSVASANWHATLTCVAERLDTGMLVDLGSTTTDLLPFTGARSCAQGGDDLARMRNGELCYSGVIRTPVHAVASALPWCGTWQPLIPERFADMADVYRLLARLHAHQDVLDTADGGSRDAYHCARRLARMIGTDLEAQAALGPWQAAARYLEECHLHQLSKAVLRILSRHPELHHTPLVAAGAGAFLIERCADRLGMQCIPAVDLLEVPEALRTQAGTCASALALARLGHAWPS